MKHLGNICEINGAAVAAVDVVIGGSPCQDLSVAGKRAGLDGERSGLFMEQIRTIKEMRNATNGTQPRYMVWENVPGAFSSNKGEDFRIVLEETAKIADEAAIIPRPDKGKWTNAGAIMGDGWSIAWRVFDAQFWGVPQRRRRIALVADFGGQSAPEILFERNGVSGDISESGAEGQGVTGGVEKGTTYAIDHVITTGGNCTAQGPCISDSAMYTLKAGGVHAVASVADNGAVETIGLGRISEPVTYPGVGITSKQNSSKGTPGVCHTLNQDERNYVVAGFCQGASPAAQTIGYQEEVSPTIKGAPSGTAQVPAVFDARGNGDGEIAPTMTGDHNEHISDYTSIVAYQSVRRLTPLECERLQGFPDNWTNIPPQTDATAEDLSFWRTVWDEWQAMNGAKPKTDKQIIKWLQSEPADSARYKALGNSIALPPWRFVLSRIHKQGARTMASLFDGIGGFPKIWQELGGQALWSSEVEPFCVKVTKYHFKEATP